LHFSPSAVFSIAFEPMTNLARSTATIDYASYSYHLSHLLMLAISLILLAGFVNERNTRQLYGKSIAGAEAR
jgi:hypothetical protein